VGKAVKKPQVQVQTAGPDVLSLTQGLLVSGALNVLLLIIVVGMLIRETPPLAFASFRESSSLSMRGPLKGSSIAFLEILSTKSFAELIPLFQSNDALEEGVTKRDLVLAWMVAAHHFDLRKALFGLSKPISDRIVRVKVSEKTWELRLFPRLPQKHFESITQFLATEKWPFDAEGLYSKLKEGMREPTLVEAFLWTKEYLLVERLLKETGLNVRPDEIVTRLLAQNWTLEMWRFPPTDQLYALFQVQKPKEIAVRVQTPSASKTYVVQEGDSLWKIAKKEGVTVEKIKAKNPSLPSVLKPGIKIELP